MHFATLGPPANFESSTMPTFEKCRFVVQVQHMCISAGQSKTSFFSIELPVFCLELVIIFMRLGLLDKYMFSLKGRQAIKRSSKAEGEPDNGAGRFPGGAA